MPHKRPDAVVQFFPQVGNLFGVVGQRFLSPSVGCGTEQTDQQRGGGNQHFVLKRVGVHGWFALHGGREGGFHRDEHHHDFGRVVETVPVRFLCQFLPAILDRFDMAIEQFFALIFVLHRIQIRRKRNFRVHRNRPATGQVHHHVRSVRSGFGFGVGLGAEITVFGHARHFDNALQLHFAPAAALIGPFQGTLELLGFVLEGGVGGNVFMSSPISPNCLVRSLARVCTNSSCLVSCREGASCVLQPAH